MAQAVYSLTTSENRKLAVLMRMALTYADAAGAEPDASKRAELLDLCMDLLAASANASPLGGDLKPSRVTKLTMGRADMG